MICFYCRAGENIHRRRLRHHHHVASLLPLRYAIDVAFTLPESLRFFACRFFFLIYSPLLPRSRRHVTAGAPAAFHAMLRYIFFATLFVDFHAAASAAAADILRHYATLLMPRCFFVAAAGAAGA